VPLHFPEHEAVEVFGAVEEYEAARRGDPVPRMRATLVGDGTLSPAAADQITESARAEMAEAVRFGLDSPFPEPDQATNFVYAD
jgi:TPP-dependent pyruvate/acetoin dehydrogenase alpha subunit